ncbi:MAG: peptidyl-prolyl cis-trans isomerase [bacterium]|nr:peptidyl-prolyl cis-trans isomerase [bacterium]
MTGPNGSPTSTTQKTTPKNLPPVPGVTPLPTPPKNSKVQPASPPAHVPWTPPKADQVNTTATPAVAPRVESAAFPDLPLPPLPTNHTSSTATTDSLTTGLPAFPGVPAATAPTFPQPPSGKLPAQLGPYSRAADSGPRQDYLTSLVGTKANQPSAQEQTQELDSGSLVAVVGADHILAGDMAQYVEPIIEQNRSRISSPAEERRLREQVVRQVLRHYIEIKALYQEFFRDAAGSSTPDKIDDMKKDVLTRASKIFFEQQVPVMLEKYEAENIPQLEAILREKSLSLSTMKSSFVEQVLAQELERKYVPNKYEITRDELLAYYQEHKDEWNVPEKARWKQLTVRFDKHDNDRQVVEALIKQLGNQVYLGGQSFEAVAKQSSEDFHADQGGIYDWASKGSLKSTPLQQAIFSIPLGRLSQVITDDVGMHIVVVLERTEAHTKSFAEAQKEIRETLSNARRRKESEAFRKKVLARTPIWTRWPEDLKDEVQHVRPLEEAIGPGLDG